MRYKPYPSMLMFCGPPSSFVTSPIAAHGASSANATVAALPAVTRLTVLSNQIQYPLPVSVNGTDCCAAVWICGPDDCPICVRGGAAARWKGMLVWLGRSVATPGGTGPGAAFGVMIPFARSNGRGRWTSKSCMSYPLNRDVENALTDG